MFNLLSPVISGFLSPKLTLYGYLERSYVICHKLTSYWNIWFHMSKTYFLWKYLLSYVQDLLSMEISDLTCPKLTFYGNICLHMSKTYFLWKHLISYVQSYFLLSCLQTSSFLGISGFHISKPYFTWSFGGSYYQNLLSSANCHIFNPHFHNNICRHGLNTYT